MGWTWNNETAYSPYGSACDNTIVHRNWWLLDYLNDIDHVGRLMEKLAEKCPNVTVSRLEDGRWCCADNQDLYSMASRQYESLSKALCEALKVAYAPE